MPDQTAPIEVARTPCVSAAFDDAAWMRMLIADHADVVHRIAISQVGPDLADDVVSETFAAAWRTRESFDPSVGAAKPWILGIALNRCLSLGRANRRWQRRAGRAIGERGDTADFAPATDARLDARAHGAALLKAVAGLPVVQKSVFVLVAVGGLEPAEVAGVLGIPPATVRSHLLRARRALASAIDLEDGSDA